eukprot:XP_013977446.1 F-box only protein 15 isoform X3 [Canis lupus familiaris]
MATGRGRLLLQHWRGLLALHWPPGGVGAAPGLAGEAPGPAGFRKRPGTSYAGTATLKQCARRGRHYKQPSADHPASLESMPSEILLKIFSYLDAVTLLCTGCVNRRFYHLANDNFIWIRIYSTAFSPKISNWQVNSAEKTTVSMNLLSVEDKEAGYWKKEYIAKQRASVKAALARVLKPVNPYTGLPVKTKEALRISGLGWVIILKEKNGKEYIMQHIDLLINDSSVTIIWYGRNWPQLATLSTLDLCGVTPVFRDRSKPPSKNGPRWLSLIAKYNLSNLTESTMIGWDRLIRIFCLHPGLLVGLWKSCSIMDITLLDEYGKPFWCLSSPVCMRSSVPSDGPNFLGQTYCVDYVDSEGKVHVELVWIKETEEYFIVSLVLYLKIAKINHWFGTAY